MFAKSGQSHIMLAKFKGRCKVCGHPIEVGWRIQKHPSLGYVHIECANGDPASKKEIFEHETHVRKQATGGVVFRGETSKNDGESEFFESRQKAIRSLNGDLFAPLKKFLNKLPEPWRVFRFDRTIDFPGGQLLYVYRPYYPTVISEQAATIVLDDIGLLWAQTDSGDWDLHPEAGNVLSDIMNDEFILEALFG